MNQGNPFKLKALVDKWPDFNTVVIRPQEEVSCNIELICLYLHMCFIPSMCLAYIVDATAYSHYEK